MKLRKTFNYFNISKYILPKPEVIFELIPEREAKSSEKCWSGVRRTACPLPDLLESLPVLLCSTGRRGQRHEGANGLILGLYEYLRLCVCVSE